MSLMSAAGSVLEEMQASSSGFRSRLGGESHQECRDMLPELNRIIEACSRAEILRNTQELKRHVSESSRTSRHPPEHRDAHALETRLFVVCFIVTQKSVWSNLIGHTT